MGRWWRGALGYVVFDKSMFSGKMDSFHEEQLSRLALCRKQETTALWNTRVNAINSASLCVCGAFAGVFTLGKWALWLSHHQFVLEGWLNPHTHTDRQYRTKKLLLACWSYWSSLLVGSRLGTRSGHFPTIGEQVNSRLWGDDYWTIGHDVVLAFAICD